ncbi:MAG: hypothetical protein H6861_05545 [Rhodospirillales bacterium]|nr:hypothetical protein [Rhodospirillales bacterium]
MAFAVWPHIGQAQKVLEQFRKKMPEFELLSEEEFLSKTDELVNESFEDKALHFKMRTPNGWTDMTRGGLENVSISKKIMGEIVRFYGPPDLYSERSYLTVEAMGMDYYMTVEQWLMQYLLTSGHNVQGLTIHDDNYAEVLYVFIRDNISYVARAAVITNGKYVLYAQYVVPVERWHDEKVMQKMILDSFAPTVVVKDYIEKMETYPFLDLAELRYPESWKLKAMPIRTIDRLEVQLVNTYSVENDARRKTLRLDGQIVVTLVSIYDTETLEDELEVFKEDLLKKGLIMGEVIEARDDFILGDRFDFVDTQVYQAIPDEKRLIDHELWLTAMSAGDYYYFVSLFTPSRDEEYFKWARNVETYKLVVNEIRPRSNSDSADDD